LSRLLCLSNRWVRNNVPVGFSPADVDSLRFAFASVAAGFISRPAAEEDYCYKQVCTYCVVRHDGLVLSYGRGRSGGESELHSSLSLGVGGHVEESDMGGRRPDPLSIRFAAQRELNEELIIYERILAFRLAGLVHHYDDPVGSRHVGFVYTADVSGVHVGPREDAIVCPSFVGPGLARKSYGRYERWSQILLDHPSVLTGGV
jgi:predicted NUDIX family phosphoesterase